MRRQYVTALVLIAAFFWPVGLFAAEVDAALETTTTLSWLAPALAGETIEGIALTRSTSRCQRTVLLIQLPGNRHVLLSHESQAAPFEIGSKIVFIEAGWSLLKMYRTKLSLPSLEDFLPILTDQAAKAAETGIPPEGGVTFSTSDGVDLDVPYTLEEKDDDATLVAKLARLGLLEHLQVRTDPELSRDAHLLASALCGEDRGRLAAHCSLATFVTRIAAYPKEPQESLEVPGGWALASEKTRRGMLPEIFGPRFLDNFPDFDPLRPFGEECAEETKSGEE
jgi:hypothetical protein